MSLQKQSMPVNPSRRATRIGFFWPVIFIALGCILLLNNINMLPGSAWDWIWRMWPVVLVAMGLDSVVRREYVGAALLTALGCILIAINLGFLAMNVWEVVVRLWPLFLIAAGISLIFDRRWLRGFGSVIGVGLVLAILSGSVALVNSGIQTRVGQGGLPTDGQAVNQPLNGATSANLHIEPVTGILNISALSESSALVSGSVSPAGDDNLIQSGQMDGRTANYTLRSDGATIGYGPTGNQWKQWDLRLAPDLPMALAVKMAVGEANLDISGMQVADLIIDMAVGATSLILPRDMSIIVKVSHAVGALTIVVPPGTAIRIIHHGALSTVTMPSGYTHNGSDYNSPNYDSTTRRIDLYVSQAIGTLSLLEQTGR